MASKILKYVFQLPVILAALRTSKSDVGVADSETQSYSRSKGGLQDPTLAIYTGFIQDFKHFITYIFFDTLYYQFQEL